MASERGVPIINFELMVQQASEHGIPGREQFFDHVHPVIASHRISALSDADLILVFREGRVVERGTHAELLAVGGYYADAHALQRQRDALEGREGS